MDGYCALKKIRNTVQYVCFTERPRNKSYTLVYLHTGFAVLQAMPGDIEPFPVLCALLRVRLIRLLICRHLEEGLTGNVDPPSPRGAFRNGH